MQKCGFAGRERTEALDAVGRDDHHLARLDVADEASADDVERAGLRCKDRRAVEVAEHQRPDTVRVARADHLLRRQADQGPRPFDLGQRVDHAVDEARAAAGGDEMEDDFGVGGRLEDRAALLEPLLQRQGIGNVAVMGDGKSAAGKFGEERLDIPVGWPAMGRVSVMADRPVARQSVHHGSTGKIVAHQAKVPFGVEFATVKRDDARSLLAAVLKRVETERGELRRVLVAEDAEDPALLMELVGVGQGPRSLRARQIVPVLHAAHCAVPPSLFSMSWSIPCCSSGV